MGQITQRELSDSDHTRIKKVVREFLAQDFYEELWETRIQKLIFYTEVYCLVFYRKRMTNARYKPYMFGAYSVDVNSALEDMNDLDRTPVVRNGKRTVAYSLGSDGERLDNKLKPVIKKVHYHTMDQSTNQLAQFSKNNWLFENTEYDHPMDFGEFVEALDENPKIEEELKNQLPEKANISKDRLIDPM